MAVTEKGYRVALYKEEKEGISITNKYIDLCEKTVKHLVSIINMRELQGNFSDEVLQDALKIKEIYEAREKEEKKNGKQG